jgi:hypothetical protein
MRETGRTQDEVRASLKLAVDGYVVLYSGTVNGYKGLDVLTDALSFLLLRNKDRFT